MRVEEWEQPSRVLSDYEVDIFFNRPLEAPALFQFTTNQFETPTHAGAFSLKWVMSGEEEYRIGKRSVRLRPGQFLFVNEGEDYSSHIRGKTRSGSLFVPETDQVSALASLTPGDFGLAGPETDGPPKEVPQCAFSLSKTRSQQVAQLLSQFKRLDGHAQTELSRLLLIEALRTLYGAAPASALMHYAKRATRDELLQRLARAKAEIDETGGKVAGLERLAGTACLSKYYFLRLFKEVYGTTPVAYAQRLRQQRAVRAIAAGEDPKKAARAAGYTDMRAFRRACGRIGGTGPAN